MLESLDEITVSLGEDWRIMNGNIFTLVRVRRRITRGSFRTKRWWL